MALAISQINRRNADEIKFRVTPSGSYSTGGDTLDTTALNATKVPLFILFVSQAGYVYTFVPGANPTVGKMMVFCNTAGASNAGLGEHTAATYNAGVTGDVIDGIAFYSGSF